MDNLLAKLTIGVNGLKSIPCAQISTIMMNPTKEEETFLVRCLMDDPLLCAMLLHDIKEKHQSTNTQQNAAEGDMPE